MRVVAIYRASSLRFGSYTGICIRSVYGRVHDPSGTFGSGSALVRSRYGIDTEEFEPDCLSSTSKHTERHRLLSFASVFMLPREASA